MSSRASAYNFSALSFSLNFGVEPQAASRPAHSATMIVDRVEYSRRFIRWDLPRARGRVTGREAILMMQAGPESVASDGFDGDDSAPAEPDALEPEQRAWLLGPEHHQQRIDRTLAGLASEFSRS